MGRGAFKEEIVRSGLPGLLIEERPRVSVVPFAALERLTGGKLRSDGLGLYLTADNRFCVRRGRTKKGFTGSKWCLQVSGAASDVDYDLVEAIPAAALFRTRKEALQALEKALEARERAAV